MNGLSVDSTKLLTEKLALSRELAVLKPELDHLRSQASYQQTVLAEKLALQRQMSTLEVELETEKRASKRTGQKDKDNQNENEYALQKQVDELRKELAREKREKEKAQEAGERGASDWEARKASLESKVEQLRAKLRETKDQVKELNKDLAKAQAAAVEDSTSSLAPVALKTNLRKRTAAQMSSDATIGTPDGVATRGKRPTAGRAKPEKTVLGEKSMFSITPFLNRTIIVAPETPQQEPQSEVLDEQEQEPSTPAQRLRSAAEERPVANPLPSSKQDKRKAGTEKSILTNSKKGAMNVKRPPKNSGIVVTLEKVNEEGVDENTNPVSTKLSKQTQVMEPKKKRRKLLGGAKTLFDEEDGEATKRPTKISLGPARSLGKGALADSKTSFKAGLGGNMQGFGAFSPLKRDKRGVQASFLN
jgi:hypothetical protein